MVTAVIYARVPTSLKEALEAHASQRGLTLTAAVVEVLERGLEAAANTSSVDELQRRVQELVTQHAATRGELLESQAKVQTLEERAQTLQATYQALAQRMEQQIGPCPKCQEPLSGHDLLVVGHCPHCRSSLSSLLSAGAARSGLDEKELWLLIGALGLVLVGATYLQSKST